MSDEGPVAILHVVIHVDTCKTMSHLLVSLALGPFVNGRELNVMALVPVLHHIQKVFTLVERVQNWTVGVLLKLTVMLLPKLFVIADVDRNWLQKKLPRSVAI